MVKILTVANGPFMNDVIAHIKNWNPMANGWVDTYYNYYDESDHLAHIASAANGEPIEILDCVCHGDPGSFDGTNAAGALSFGQQLAGLPGFSRATAVYLDACNTALTSDAYPTPIAQTVADGARCTVYGVQGYMTEFGSYAEDNEECFPVTPGETGEAPYPGSIHATKRHVWLGFGPRSLQEPDFVAMRTVSFGVDRNGKVWAGFDPAAFARPQMNRATSVTIHTGKGATKDLEEFVNSILHTDLVRFPRLRIAPDAAITYIREHDVKVLDIYANGGLVRDRITGQTWAVGDPKKLRDLVARHRD